jgi:hypothetical protein
VSVAARRAALTPIGASGDDDWEAGGTIFFLPRAAEVPPNERWPKRKIGCELAWDLIHIEDIVWWEKG